MSRNVVIVGGGVAGLAASIYLARAGRVVTLFDKRRALGGRAITHRRKGFRFNLGPHALYRGGAGSRVLKELGIPIEGGTPPNRGFALYRGAEHLLPANPFALLGTSILSPRGKAEAARVLWRLRRMNPAGVAGISLAQWLDENIDDGALREVVRALIRLATYSDDAVALSAGAAIGQLQIAMKRGVLYVHEGWQKIVDAMHSAAVAAGVNFISSSRVVGVTHDHSGVQGIELGGLEGPLYDDTVEVSLQEALERSRGTRMKAGTVLLAIDPRNASSMLEHEDGPAVMPRWQDTKPVTLACLDVALDSLPKPKRTFAVGIDRPYYFSVHSHWAHLAPKGGALLHVAKYLRDSERGDLIDSEDDEDTVRSSHSTVEAELETLLDQIQPGWRDRVVHKRFLPNMIVSNALPRADSGGLSGRQPVSVGDIPNLYLAGDWVGEEGLLSDASLASARAAARRILAS